MSHDVLVRPPRSRSAVPGGSGGSAEAAGARDGSKSTTSTPRKTQSSRFMAAFTQFYGPDEDPSTSPPEEVGTELRGKVESKLMSMWNNVKYGWSGKMKANFSKEQPIWLLGRCYHRKFSPPPSMESSMELNPMTMEARFVDGEPLDDVVEGLDPDAVHELGTDVVDEQNGDTSWEEEGVDAFKRDFMSRLWMTYRREFPAMNGGQFTSDCGWGCMLRSGQMMLAQGLICHFLGRNWRWDPDTQLYTTQEDNLHRKIIRWFGDISSRNSPFSIHTLVTLGQEAGKKPGDWYAPGATVQLLRQAMLIASQENVDLDGINIHVAQDCTVYIQDILDECLIPAHDKSLAPWHRKRSPTREGEQPENAENFHWKALILLVPLRLGAEKMNQIYGNSLKALLSLEASIGIIGGRPKHSLYFVGHQEDKLIYLDPHYCQEMVDVNQENFLVNSFHCKSPRKMKISKMDPSCCVGFYCPTKSDFDHFIASVQPYLLPLRSPQTRDRNHAGAPATEVNYPMFVFCRGKRCDQEVDLSHLVYSQQNSMSSAASGTVTDDEGDEDEFVIL
ncbi:cysteine protease ATG4C [Phlebotomus argentipes]|uniref:cysteine protease ATG4C n=1 Tax=Phlebotomus argentipes TaxID=94469 RepID=UPI00289338A2|nr:cysteine protease ATG4C [Phlebotomus argentipes]XP_059610553.1 cysteine protease ATG4C [Phlebotomus argentipes]